MTVRQTCLTRAMTHAHRIRFHVKPQALRLLVMSVVEKKALMVISAPRSYGTSHEYSGGSTQ